MALLLVLGSAVGAVDVLDAQAPKRQGDAAGIRAAGTAFAEGVAAISDNLSAFTQDVRLSGCEVVITTHRRDRADSLMEIHSFDAGHLTARPPERISLDATTGAILFRFPTVDSAARVTRTRRRSVNAGKGGTAPAVEERAEVPELLVLAANTSQQHEVQTFLRGWKELVRVCGGDSSTGDEAR